MAGEDPQQTGDAASAGGGLWRLPAVGLGVVLLAGGVYTAVSNRPAPDHRPALRLAAEQLDDEAFSEAIGTLNGRVFPYLANGSLPPDLAGEYHLLLSRAIAGGQRDLAVRVAENDRNVVRQLLEAERLGAAFGPRDHARLADAFIALGRFEEAERRIDLIPETSVELRESMVRTLVDARLEQGEPALIPTLEYLGRMLSEPGLSETHRLWALARQARVRLELGFADEAVTQLLRELPLLQEADPTGVGELYKWLGRAYFELDALEQAERALERATIDDALPAGDPRHAMAGLYLARVAARSAQDSIGLERARDAFAAVVDRAGGTEAYLPALLGLGEMEAALDQITGSLDVYAGLVEELDLRRHTRESASVTPEAVADSLVARYRERAGANDVIRALEYASLAGRLFSFDQTPPEVLEAQGLAHEARAEDLLGGERSGLRLRDLVEIDPGTLQQVKRHLIQAAGFFRAHADRFILDDYGRYGDSLWRAAGLYDRAGDTRSTVAALTEFTEAVRDDPRRAEGRFTLAQAHQALGQYDLAAVLYRGLIADRARDARDGVGVWADRAHVPLAQSLLLDGDIANDSEAEDMLLAALDGRRGGPDRPEYRDALFELGRVFDRSGRFDLAIERLDEFLRRAPDDPRALSATFRLADSYRRLAADIEEGITGGMRQSRVRELRREREEHLARAIELFERVRDGLGEKPGALRTRLEDVHLRNAFFYLGDCAFDLGEYPRAIAYYSASRNRYPRDPAVLVAMIQIVNAYVEMGDFRSARTANERARDFYASLPDEVWDDPDLPMGRRDWERWLESSARLYAGMGTGG